MQPDTSTAILGKVHDSMLPVKLSETEIVEVARSLAEASQKKSALEDEKRRITKEFASKITAQEVFILRFSTIVETGEDDRPVKTQWLYHYPTSGKKTMVRLDTQETVEEREMSDWDYDVVAELQQLELDLK